MAGIDPYTVLLIHGNGVDGSADFPDTTTLNHAITAVGNAQVDTAQKKFGTGSVLLDGTGDWLSLADSDDWNFGSGDFTIDLWIKRNATGATYLFGQSNATYSATSRAWEINLTATGVIQGRVWVAGANQEAPSPGSITNDGLFHHLALIRYGNNLYLYLDGVSGGAKDITGLTVQNSTNPLYIGSLAGLTPVNGWLDEIRVSKGIARWTADFTPPTEEYSAIVEMYQGDIDVNLDTPEINVREEE